MRLYGLQVLVSTRVAGLTTDIAYGLVRASFVGLHEGS